MLKKKLSKEIRRQRIRKKVSGTPERLRLSIFRSLNNIYVQIIDDIKGHTLISASTMEKEIRGKGLNKGNKEMAKKIGQIIAERAIKSGIKKIVFDRSGFKYHGCIKSLAEGAREVGLEF